MARSLGQKLQALAFQQIAAPEKNSRTSGVVLGVSQYREVLREILTELANTMRDEGEIEEHECFNDATSASANGGGEEIGKTKRGKVVKIQWSAGYWFVGSITPQTSPVSCSLRRSPCRSGDFETGSN